MRENSNEKLSSSMGFETEIFRLKLYALTIVFGSPKPINLESNLDQLHNAPRIM